MMTAVLMAAATAASIFLILKIKGADKAAAAEVVISRALSCRFARQELEEKKEAYLKKEARYRTDSDRKAAKKVKEWEKQEEALKKKEEACLSGTSFSVLDAAALFGYQLLSELRLDHDSDLLRKLTAGCERTGYVELERDQEMNGRKTSAVYACYLLASLFSFMYLGVILSCFLGVVMTAVGNTGMSLLLPMAAGFCLPALYGYLPYDSLRVRAGKRQEEIDRSFPDAASKIALLVTAGMNVMKAVEQTASGGDSLMNRELQLAVKEMAQGATVQKAFSRIQCRCNNKYLDKMATIITKSYVSGNARLAEDLRAVNEECWLDKKHSARRMGEQVQNRLFIPTMLMFIGILIVIVVPAMSGFNL